MADGEITRRRFGPALHTLYSELGDRLRDAEIEGLLDRERSFIRRTRHGNRYGYSRRFVSENGGDRREEHYLGPDTSGMHERFERLKQQAEDAKLAARARRRLVRQLVGAGFPHPDRRTGRVLEELARAGVFRLGGVLIGSHAFAAYSGHLGVRPPEQQIRTSDGDVASRNPVHVAITEQAHPRFRDAIDRAERFVDIPSLDRRTPSTERRTADKELKIELLTPLTGPPRKSAASIRTMGAHAHPLRFLDYLIADTISAVVLTGTGVLVQVPSPERYALHKLIVARKRSPGEQAKRAKDRAQAASLLAILLMDSPEDVTDAWADLASRGDGWERPARQSMQQLPEDVATRLRDLLS